MLAERLGLMGRNGGSVLCEMGRKAQLNFPVPGAWGTAISRTFAVVLEIAQKIRLPKEIGQDSKFPVQILIISVKPC